MFKKGTKIYKEEIYRNLRMVLEFLESAEKDVNNDKKDKPRVS
jgi:hypothetical protein